MDDVRVEGAAMLKATLRTALARIEASTKAREATGRQIQLRARDRAPRRTGRLASSIVVRSTGEVTSVSSSLVYAPVIHQGWRAHNIPPRPFLIPVAEDTLDDAVASYYQPDAQAALRGVKGA